MDFLTSVLNYLWSSILATGTQFLVLLGPLLALAFILDQIAVRLERVEGRVFGGRNFIRYFAVVGVPVHELGHAMFCPIFGHKITEIKLFRPDPDSGTLGYVRHSFNPNSYYQQVGNFFIGIGPIFSGGLVIFAAMHLAAGHSVTETFRSAGASYSGAGDLLSLASSTLSGALAGVAGILDFSRMLSWKFWVFLYVVLAVGGNVTLSRADVQGASRGFGTLVVVLLLANLVFTLFGGMPMNYVYKVAAFGTPLYSVLLVAALLNLAMMLLLKGVATVRGR